MRILIAEDDARLLKSLVHILKLNNFSADGVDNGADALEYAKTGEYDGLILDIMMPKMDGIQVLRQLREAGFNTPALFLTSKTSISQRVEGLDAGADDYLPKPFSTDELLARVRAMLRRRDSFIPDLLCCGPVILNRSTYELTCQNRSVSLSGKEFQVMEILMENPHIVVTTEQLITKIWGWDTAVDTSVVWVHISNLRKKLAALSAPIRIRFQRGAGYILEGEP
ncbi:MAG: response regulator transcription factor [Oscillospiraceae bacterium]|nr:response regulator transcription factor [Oscillospiraceae bacterium]MCD7934660.1 response regulator transcription factor [Oscillospiraceae bacterium]